MSTTSTTTTQDACARDVPDAPLPARRRAEWLVVALAVALFLGLALYHYRLPGLYYDEAADVVPAMQLLKGQPVRLQRGVGIHLFGRDFPVMIGDYWGTTSTYAVLPLFAVFGVGVLPVRLFPIAAGALALVLTYLLGRRLFDGRVGALAALLLAGAPTFVFWSRVGIYVISHIVAIALGVMLCYLAWRARPRRWLLVLGAFLAGLGLTTKLLFVWFFIAVPAAYVALLGYDWLAARHPPPRAFVGAHARRYLPLRDARDAAALVAGFLAGAFPVLYYNLVSRGSYELLRANLGRTERGVDNTAILSNLGQQARELRVFLDGGFFWFFGGVYTNPLATYVVAASVVVLALLTLLPEHARHRRTLVFLYAYAATLFLLSAFSISILAATHLFILLPLPQLAVAACGVLGARSLAARLRPARLALVAPAALLAGLGLFVALDLRADVRYHGALTRTGGVTTFSSAIYPLAGYLDARGAARPYALDWGVRANVQLLTEGRVNPQELYGLALTSGGAFDAAIAETLREPSPRFIVQTPPAGDAARLERLQQLVAAAGRSVELERVFRGRDGAPAYALYRVTPR